MTEKNEIVSFDSFVRSQKNQELKGLLLKLKNEIRREEVLWEDVKEQLAKVHEYDGTILETIMPLIVEE